MRVARAAFLAGPALLLVAALALGASFVADRRHARKRIVVDDDDLDTPAPAPRREMPSRRLEPEAAPPEPESEPPPERLDSLRLRVDGPHGLRLRSVSIMLSPVRDDRPREVHHDEEGDDAGDVDGSDTDEASGATTYEVDAEPDGQFLVEELDPGRYDLTVSAEGLEEARLASVPSDAVGIHLTLARPPVLIGAIGGGQTACHGMHVLAEQQDTTDEQDVDDDCAFAFENLHRGTPAHLNDPRPDHHHGERTADVPAEGDPPPFCLDPPCAFLPSALVVLFADSEGFLASDVTLSWDVATSEDGGYGGIRMGTSSAVIAGLTAGAQVHLRAGDDDHTVESDVIVPFGIAEVVLTVPADEETAED